MGSDHKVPLIEEQLLRDEGTHLTTRVLRASSRPVIHRPIRDFNIGTFADSYLPVRESSNYRQRRNKIGYLWMSKSGKLRAFESMLERSILLDLDRDPSVKRLWTQPFRVDGLDDNRGGRYVRPTPDILVEYVDETLEVIEVKPQRAVDQPDEQRFAGNAEAFDDAMVRWQRLQNSLDYQRRELAVLGIKVSTRSEMSAARRQNLEYMSLYRRPLAKGDELDKTILDRVAAGPLTVMELAERSEGFVSAMPVILHMVWHRRLMFDMEEPLNAESVVHLPAATMISAAA